MRLIRQAGENGSLNSRSILSGIYSSEGFIGLWRGHAVNLSRVVPSYAVRLGVFGNLSGISWMNPFLAGSLSGLASSLVSYPIDVIRTRMSLGSSLSESFYRGSLFAGCWLTVAETMPYAALSLGTYTYLTKRYSYPSERVISGLLAGALATLVCFPLDTIKRNRIVYPERTVYTLVYELYHSGGWKRFYRGISLTILKAPPTVALTMFVNDMALDWLDTP